MNNIPIFGEHPSQALKDAYRGYQGCPPEQAKIIFIGKDHRAAVTSGWSV